MLADLVFYAFALLTVISAGLVVFKRNVVHAGFSLLFTLFGVAGLFATLGADFLAVTQTIVYIGGILILVLFVVMMTRVRRDDAAPGPGFGRLAAGGLLAVGVFALLFGMIREGAWTSAEMAAPQPTIAEIGVKLLTDYIFPFEFASLVLLVAMIGAALVIRERRGDAAEEETS